MNNADIVAAGDEWIEKYDRKELVDKVDLLKALSNKWFRLNTLYWIKDKGGKKILFRPNYAQRDVFATAHIRDLILKARQLGFTTFEMISSLDECLFTVNVNCGCIAHTFNDAKDIYRNKIKFAYEKISDYWLRVFKLIGYQFPTPKNDRGEGYVFSNGSSIQVGTSYRGGTLQRLHVSEFGKICAKFPEKAEEIVSGAFESVGSNGRITIESTAEGREGRFFQYAQDAEIKATSKEPLTKLDFKFHFYPWHENDDYRINPDDVIIPQQMKEYFDELELVIQKPVDAGQRAWYVKKHEVLQDKMKREYPGTPKEAFENAIAGAYYTNQMAQIRARQQIRSVPYDQRLPVHCFFDLGRNDATSIWFMQEVHGEYRFIRYYENNGENIQFYLRHLQTLGYVYGTLYLPHDAAVKELTRADNKSRADVVRSAGFRVHVVPRCSDKLEAINMVRDVLPLCWFDAEGCDLGIKHLDAYRKEWDDRYGVWKDRPFHNDASHGNDAIQQFALGYRTHTNEQDSFEPEWD